MSYIENESEIPEMTPGVCQIGQEGVTEMAGSGDTMLSSDPLINRQRIHPLTGGSHLIFSQAQSSL